MFDTEIAALATGHHRLPLRDSSFASSLLDQLGRRGALSPKQWPWIKTLADRLAALDNPAAAPKAASLGDTAELLALFAKAAGKLKFPHLLVNLTATENAKIWIAGPKARVPGSLTIVNTWTQRKRVGTLHVDGSWEPAPGRTAEDAAKIIAVLAELLADPTAALARHGKLLGLCSFCRSNLSDDRSLAMGYGPVCAKNWGLPWGKPARAKLVCDQAELIAA